MLISVMLAIGREDKISALPGNKHCRVTSTAW
jgi:hypothetical protein